MTTLEPTQLLHPSHTLDALASATAMLEETHQSPVAMTEPASLRHAHSSPSHPWLHRVLTTAMLASFALAGWFFATSPTSSTTVASVSKPALKAAAKPERRYVTKNIEDIREGDYVLAREEHGTKLAYRQVAKTYGRTSYHLRHLTFEAQDGTQQTLHTTDEHPFWHAKRNVWLNAGHFKTGDSVNTPDGRLQKLIGTHRTEHPESIPVFNFEVAGYHTYFVRSQLGTPLLVHNAPFCSPDPGVADLANAIEKKYPGHVLGVNTVVGGHEVDILLKNAIIEVKKGNGKGLTKQVIDRLEQGLPVIGFSPNMGPSAAKSINNAGGIAAGGAASSLDDLIELVKP